MSHQSDLTRAIETALKLSQRADLGELPRPAQAEASEGARPVEGMTAKNWELAYDKACRERDEVKAERDSLAEQYRQACIDSDKWEAEARRQPAQGGLPGVGTPIFWIGQGREVKVTSHWEGCVNRITGDPVDGFNCEEQVAFTMADEGTSWRRVPQPQPAAETIPLVASAKVKGDPDMLYIDAGCDSYLVRCKPASRAAAIAKLLTEATMPAVATKEEP